MLIIFSYRAEYISKGTIFFLIYLIYSEVLTVRFRKHFLVIYINNLYLQIQIFS